jgi:hypothetical protein
MEMKKMWQPIDGSIFGDMNPVKTYLYYDGPRSFSIQHNGRTFYVHQCDEELEYWTYWVREVSKSDLALLENNGICLRQFIKNADPLYLVREYGGEKPHEAFIVKAEDFSEAYFPNDDVYLNQQSEVRGEDEHERHTG